MSDTQNSIKKRQTEPTEQSSGSKQRSVSPQYETCPECNGEIISKGGDRLCSECALVVSETIDSSPGSQQALHSETPKSSNGRGYGPPTTGTRHTRVGGTEISSSFVDANGNTLDSKTQRKFARLRKRQRQETYSKKDTNTIYGIKEIGRMGGALGLPDSIIDQAKTIYRQYHQSGPASGKSLDTIAAGALYLAIRVHSHPALPEDVVRVSQINQDTGSRREQLFSEYQDISDSLGVYAEPQTPDMYVPRLVNGIPLDNFDFSYEIEQKANKIISNARGSDALVGRRPSIIAAAAIWQALPSGQIDGIPTQADIAEAAECTPPALRDVARALSPSLPDGISDSLQ
jgi:transcription initiation factor TFIIB